MFPTIFLNIEDCPDCDAAIETLTRRFVKPPNEIFAQHLLASRRQQSGETLSKFLRELHKLSKHCNIKAVSAEEYREELVCDIFINRLASPLICQRLLENKQLDLQTAFDQANGLDQAQKNSEAYMTPVTQAATAGFFPR